MKNIIFRILVFAFLFTSAGCLKGVEERKCNYDPCALKAPASEVEALRTYLATNNITATEHCSGLFYTIENAGTGKTPQACYRVSVNYIGMLTDGSVFDRSLQPVTFSLNGVIRGWTNGVPLVKEGGRVILYIPPSLGYGSQEVRDEQGVVRIPPNSNLVFEIDLLAAE